MEPDGWAVVVGGGHDPVPDFGDGIAVDLASDTGDARAHHLVCETNRKTTMVLRSAGGVDRLERPHERGEIERGLDGIIEPVDGRELARQPPHDTPWVRKRFFRFDGCNGQSHGEWRW